MKTTEWKEFVEGDRLYRIRATYGFDNHGQGWYFSITGETEKGSRYDGGGRTWFEESCGCIHDQIVKHFPKLVPLIKWHLCYATSGPMHYIANAVYWWELATGRRERRSYDSDACKAFASTVVLGALDGEPASCVVDGNGMLIHCKGGVIHLRSVDDFVELTGRGCNWTPASWLEARLPALMQAMRKDMAAAGVEVP